METLDGFTFERKLDFFESKNLQRKNVPQIEKEIMSNLSLYSFRGFFEKLHLNININFTNFKIVN